MSIINNLDAAYSLFIRLRNGEDSGSIRTEALGIGEECIDAINYHCDMCDCQHLTISI